jgi:ribonuclease HI
MTKKKQYYVVIHGRQPGLYDQWFGEEGAAEQVDGLADAVYKGFYTLQEAAEWLRELHAETIPGLPPDLVDLLGLHPEPPRHEGPRALLKAGKILIYADGGAIDNPDPGGYGVVLL